MLVNFVITLLSLGDEKRMGTTGSSDDWSSNVQTTQTTTIKSSVIQSVIDVICSNAVISVGTVQY